jgi:hypothetical protein
VAGTVKPERGDRAGQLAAAVSLDMAHRAGQVFE